MLDSVFSRQDGCKGSPMGPRGPGWHRQSPRRRGALSRGWPSRAELVLFAVFATPVLLFVSFLPSMMSSTGQPPAGAPQPVPAPVFGSTGLEKPGVGFVFVGMGPYARQLKCETAIESLRRHAGWGGPVFLITDAPQCFEGERWGGCGLNATVVAVEGEGDLAAGFTVPSLTATKGNRLRSKSYKMRIFELIPDPAITTLVFMDCDILSADAPGGCLEAFLAEYAREDRFDADRRIWLFPENDDTKIQGVVHSGFFVAHREWSAPLLARWHDQLMTFTDHADQAAFVRAGITEYRFMDEPRYFYRPRCDRDDCPAMPLKCFNHINGARCIKQGADSIQTFIDRWELCSLGDAQYCTPLYMEPFAKSWLPYTTCRKMEEGLFGSWSGKKAQSMRVQSW